MDKFSFISGRQRASAALLSGLILVVIAAPAEARCPRTAVGIYSGIARTDSFSRTSGLSDVGLGLVRLTLGADGAYALEFDNKTSDMVSGESGSVSGTYAFSASNCAGQLTFNGSLFRYRLTDSGRIFNAILINQADASERDVTSFQLFRE